MKRVFFFIAFITTVFIAPGYAQLPGNPANKHGVVINDPGVVKFEWELQGDSLYYVFEITTPSTFVDRADATYRNEIMLWAYNHNDDPWFPGSFAIVFDENTFPYGYRNYSGVMDVSDYDPEWTSFSVFFGYLTGTPENPVEHLYGDLFTPFD